MKTNLNQKTRIFISFKKINDNLIEVNKFQMEYS